MAKKKRKWWVIFIVIFIATIIDIIVPDPLVLVDEVLLIGGSIFAFVKAIEK